MTRILVGTTQFEDAGVPEGTRVLVYVFDTGEVEVAFRAPDGPRWGPPVRLEEEPDG